MSIALVRHGETALNAARVIQPADTPLGERGRAQAQAVARRFAEQRPAPATILSSDLARAFETATAIAAALGGVDLQLSELLQERNFGDLRGRSYDALDYDPLAVPDAPPGGESVADFEQRVAQAFKEIVAIRARVDGDLIVVTHGLLIRTLLARHASFPAGLAVPGHLANTSVSVISAAAPHEVSKLGCTAHLDGANADDGRGLVGF
jgi:broad specificity phosphatase PhoE